MRPTRTNMLLQEARLKKGISQKELGVKLGYKSPQFVSNWERNLCPPPKDQFKDLIKILKINKDELFDAYVCDFEDHIDKFIY